MPETANQEPRMSRQDPHRDPRTGRRMPREKREPREKKPRKGLYEQTSGRFEGKSQFGIRLFTGAIYVVLTTVCVLINDITTTAMLALIAAICAGEFYWMLRSDAKLPNELLGTIAAVCYPLSVWWHGLAGAMIVTLLFLITLLVWYVFWSRARISDVAISFFGAMYCGLLPASLILIRQTLENPWGGVLILCIFLSIWANDVFAYLAGSKFGKHKLAPRVSPKKSWEGFIVGLFGSVVFWIVISFIPGVTMPIPMAIVFGFISGLSGVLGDLCESRIKRSVGFKDSGTIMPGHGGLLDRCDSMFMVSVVSAVLLIGGRCIPFVL